MLIAATTIRRHAVLFTLGGDLETLAPLIPLSLLERNGAMLERNGARSCLLLSYS